MCARQCRNELVHLPRCQGSGFEGVAVTGSEAGDDEMVWTVIQREWNDDPGGFVKIGRFNVTGDTWTFARPVHIG